MVTSIKSVEAVMEKYYIKGPVKIKFTKKLKKNLCLQAAGWMT